MKRKKYYDSFRNTHPEQKVFTRIGTYTDEGSLNSKRITMTRLDYVLTSFKIIQQLSCVAILDGFDIGSDHRPMLVSLPTTLSIPHIASLNKQIQKEQEDKNENEPLSNQPKIKYPCNTDNTEQWNEFALLTQNKFLENEILTHIPENENEIDIWAQTFSHIITASINETVGWIDPNLQPPNTTNKNTLPQQHKTKELHYTISPPEIAGKGVAIG